MDVLLPPGTPVAWLPAGDTLRVVLRRAGRAEPILDTADLADSLTMRVPVPLEQAVERFVATAELVYGGRVMFLAFEAVQLRAGLDTAITLATVYVGPGAAAATLTVAATDSTLESGDTTRVTSTALDSLGQALGRVPVRFRLLRPDLFQVDTAGLVTALDGVPDSTLVDVVMPTGLTASVPLWLIGSFTPLSGQAVVFISTRDGNREVYAMQADGTEPVRLTDSPEDEFFPTWKPDGSAIAFEREVNGARQVFVLALADRTITPLTTEGANSGPRFSPDGARLAFTSSRGGAPGMWVMDADGGNQRRIPDPFADGSALTFGDWSPDGRELVFLRRPTGAGGWTEAWASDTAGENARLVLGAAAGSIADRVVGAPGEGSIPDLSAARWGPSGGLVAFTYAGPDTVVLVLGLDQSVGSSVGDGGATFVGHAAFAGADDRFVLESNADGAHAIYRQDAGGTIVRLSPPDVAESEPDVVRPTPAAYVDRVVISPDSVALTSDESGQTFTASVVDVNGQPVAATVRWLPPADGISQLLIGPPVEIVALGVGKTYAIASYRGWRVDSAPITITPATGPSTQRLVFRIGDQIYTMRGDGTDTVRLTTPSTGGYEPAFSPDGTRIAWANRAGGNGDLWVMNADGASPTAVTSGSADDIQPSWSPDGQQVVFSANRVGAAASQRQLWVVRLDGTGLRQLTFPPAANLQDVDPAWSPDGSLILFTRFVLGSGTSSMRAVDVADGAERALPMPSGSYRFPAWVPDGTAFVYTRVNVGTVIEYLGIGRMPYPPGTESVLSTGSSPRGFAAGGHLVPSVADDGLIAFSSGLGVTVMRGDGTALSGLIPGGVPGNWQPATPPRYVATVVIGGDLATPIAVAGTRQLTASATDQDGSPIVPAGGFRWTALDPAVATVDSTGLVTGVAAGSARIVAASGIAAPDTVSVTVAAAVAALTRTWVGGDAAGLTDWAVAANWNPVGVPVAGDTVIVPATADQPVLTADATVARLRITGGSLSLGGQTLTVTGDFSTGADGAFGGAAGRVIMQDPLDTLLIGGDATWWGDTEQGYLTAGVIRFRGDVRQGFGYSSTATFTAAGTHRTILDGTSPQTVTFDSPALDTTAAHFQDLEVANPAGVTFAGDNAVRGTVTVTSGVATGPGTVPIAGSLADAVGDRWRVTNTTFTGSPSLPARLMTNVRTQGGTTLDKDIVITGNLRVAQASLDLAGHALSVSGNLVTGEDGGFGAGVLVMQSPADSLTVEGSVTFWGSSEAGLLTAGVIRVRGDFTQRFYYSSTASFTAGGTHRVVLDGGALQTLSFDSPGLDATSAHFQDLAVANGGGVAVAGGLVMAGKLRVTTPVSVTGAVTVTVADSLVTVPGSDLAPATLRLGGGMAVAGAFNPPMTEFFGTGQTIQAGLAYTDVTVTGSAAFGGPTTIAGDVLITNGTGDLTINGRTVTVGGDFQIGNFNIGTGGVLRMTDPADSLDIQGNAVFDGSSETGLLTAGVLVLRGNFSQRLFYSSAGSFAASGTHRTVFAGGAAQAVTFDTPGGDAASSHFQDLDLANTAGGLTLSTAAVVNGELRTGSAGAQSVAGTGATLSVAGLDADGLTLDNVSLSVGAGTLTRFDNVTFQNLAPEATQLAVARPGGTFTFSGLRFLTTPTTGYYVSATDAAPGDGDVLTITLTDAVPADGSALTLTSGGAVVIWAGAPAFAVMDQGLSYGCGLTTADAAYCWGANAEGKLGDGTTTQRTVPTAVAGGLTFTDISAGGQHSCGLDPDGLAYCWGSNAYGQLGDGSTTDRLTPVAVVGGLSYSAITAGEQFTCAVQASTGLLYCWGRNTYGQLGDGTTTDRATLGPVEGVEGLVFGSVSAAIGQHACAVTTAGVGYCWGRNTNGQLGDGTSTNRLTPVAISGGLTFSMISATANEHTCGVTTGGQAWCWGWNNYGEVGDGTTTKRLAPVAVSGGLTFAAVSGGANGFTCGLTTAGAGYCWGLNNVGQLGDGTTTARLTPVAVSGGLTFLQLSAGFAHVAAVAADGTGYAWGGNGSGQLGDGTTTARSTPTAMALPNP